MFQHDMKSIIVYMKINEHRLERIKHYIIFKIYVKSEKKYAETARI